MNEAELRQLMMMLSPNAANTTYMQPQLGSGVMTYQDENRINNAYSPRTTAPVGSGAMTNKDANMLFSLLRQGNAFMPSSGDPDGMTAPPMQLSPEQIIARQQAYAQQEMIKKMTGEQLQQRDDSIFDRMLRRR